MDRQIDIVNPEFYFHYKFANQYALLLTPNAYWDMLMRIFTRCLLSQCVFTNFQCVITRLRALSVALTSAIAVTFCGFNCIASFWGPYVQTGSKRIGEMR